MRAIKPEIVKPGKPTILLSGPPKTHKSRLALQFPRPYFVDCEAGSTQPHYMADLVKSGGVYMGQAQGSQSFSNVIEEVRWLQTNKHDYQTFVLDSLSYISNLGYATEEARMLDEGKQITFGSNKKPTMRQIRRLFALLKNLDMTKIIICHAKDKWEGEGNDRKVTGTTFDGWDKLEYELDLWCESRRVGKDGIMAVRASRYQQLPIGLDVPMNYAAFAKIYGQDIIEKPSVRIVRVEIGLAAKIKNVSDMLITAKKISEDEMENWLLKDGAQEIEDLAQDRAEKLLDFLDKKLKGESK